MEAMGGAAQIVRVAALDFMGNLSRVVAYLSGLVAIALKGTTRLAPRVGAPRAPRTPGRSQSTASLALGIGPQP